MDSVKANLHDLSKIPENEFKQYFRDWMERDDVARSLQAKLRKDLIANFNKTTLGKKIINQAAITNRLTLSPLILALNTLVAEFLYALNCHFTLSVFCTEVPYRNTLPDFENVNHFRFSEPEIFEIFDALSRNWTNEAKTTICQEYVTEQGISLLFLLLKNLLNRPKMESPPVAAVVQSPKVASTPKTQKPDTKPEYQSNQFRYLNKYLIILSKKVKEMSQNLEQLQKHKIAPRPEWKSVQARKFENLNRSLEKISENLRQLSLSKRKNKRFSTVVAAIDTMAKQFERCAMNFDQVSKGFASSGRATSGPAAGEEKSYDDWVKEMKNTENGKIFLERIESALRKALHREREKMDKELEQRLSIQKDILKTKYKQKLTEELVRLTTRGNVENDQHKPNENLEKKLQEFETKHQELHQKIHETERKFIERSDATSNKKTQTANNSTAIHQSNTKPVKTQVQLQQMVQALSEEERHIDHIVFDAKLRIQELENESNQLDRTFREYLERQRAEKQNMREKATSIWQGYAFKKSVLQKNNATYRPSLRAIDHNHDPLSTVALTAHQHPIIPTINIDTNIPSSNAPPTFENPFRIAQRKVLSRSKSLTTAPREPTALEQSSVDKCTQQQLRFRLTERNDIDDIDESHRTETRVLPQYPTRRPPRPPPLTKATSVKQTSSKLKIKDITRDECEIGTSTTTKSSALSAPSDGESDNGSSSASSRAAFKLRRKLLRVSDNRSPSSSKSNSPRVNSNGNKEAETEVETEAEPLKQINTKKNGDDGRKKYIDVHTRRKSVLVMMSAVGMEQSVVGKRSQTRELMHPERSGTKGDRLENGDGDGDGDGDDGEDVDEDVLSLSFHLDISTGGRGDANDKESDSDSWEA